MFDIGWPELLLVAVLVIVVVGPKELPRVMRTVAHYVGKAKSMTREFRGYVDDMVRESELDEIKSQIEAGADLDAGGLMENTIDPDHDLRNTLEFADGDFDNGEFGIGSDLSELDAEPYDEVAGGVDDEVPETGGGPAVDKTVDDETAHDETGSGETLSADNNAGGSAKVAS